MAEQDMALEALKKKILEQRLKKKIAEQPRAAASAAIPSADRSAPLSLSWAQQRLWFLDQLDHAAGAAYHIPAALRLKGRLDRDALKKALDRIVARHENLRTTFVNTDAGPVQSIAPEDIGFALREIDLRVLDAEAREAALKREADDEARAPFDLAVGPLFRGRLLTLSDDESALLLTQHHIVSDGWSLGVLVREVTTLYAAFVEGRDDPLPPLAIQYADFAVWQRGWLQGETLGKQIAFWRDHLQGAPSLLELPTDRPRPSVQTHAGDIWPLQLSETLSRGVQALSQRHGTTSFMTLLAAWAALLARYSGQQDVVVGSPVANRQRLEVEPLIGFFVNTLALRVSIERDPTVAELLAQVRLSMLDAYSHQDLPFEQVVEALQPQRSLSYSPIFQTLFAFNNTPDGGEVPLPGLSLSPILAARHTTHFDLELGLRELDGVIRGNIGYASDLFDRTTIGRLADSFVRMLEAMVADDGQRVSALPLLSDAGRSAILDGFNATSAGHDMADSLPALFAAQVRRTPDAPAIEFEGERLTYADLDRRANRVAHQLIALGVVPDDRVAICFDRGIELVIGVLGIVKAGAGYAPLDPSYPHERLRYILQNSAPSALVSQDALLARLPLLAECPAPLLRLDAAMLDAAMLNDGMLDAVSDRDPAVPGIGPDHLAYVIHTSGSTGLPKGVAMPQGPLLNLLAWQRTADADAASPERVLQFSALGFDVAFQEMFHTLGTGGCLLPVREEVRQDPFALAAFIESQGVQRIFLPFVAFQGLVAAAEQSGKALPSLRHVVTAGEQLFVNPAIRAFFARVPGRRLHNQYGPTETHVATAHTLDAAPEAWGTTPPIGRPIANARAYLLDAHGQPVPVGVTGELFLAGDCVARGYLNRDDLTAERFLPDPFSAAPGARMYRTGDLGRWLPNGEIDYLGRNDFQVKIRGFRVELGEIEAKLSQCTGVREAVVMAREDGAGGKRLVAYLLAKPGEAQTAAALRAELARDLADYMIPAAFVIMAAWPMTPSGKLDRKALPEPDQDAVAAQAYVAPAGETEQALAGIWCSLLNLDRVGRDDHFFELGGHSLLAVQLVTQVRTRLGVELPLRTIFAEPTLAGLAGTLSGQARAAVGVIPRADRASPLPLSWSQQRLWFIDQLDHASSAAYHMPSAIKLIGPLDRDALKRTLDRIVARHENLRTTFVQGPDGAVQSIAPETAGFALAEEDLSSLAGEAREQALRVRATEEARAPFDLSRGPLIRGRLIRLAEQEHALLLTQHHIVSDGWSIGVLVREMTALYEAYATGSDDPLPALPIQYADYAVWQRNWLQGEALQAQLDFWKGHLGGAPALLELPTDRPRPLMQSHAGAMVPLSLPKATGEGLRLLSKRHGTTLFMTLMAGWATLLSRLSGQSEVVVGTPVANRLRAEVEPLVGFFLNTVAVRVDVGDDPSVSTLLGRVRELTLEAYAHQDVPFEQVVEAVQPQRSLGHSPLFQTMLSLDNTPESGASSPSGLRVEPVASARNTVHFDLDLSFSERVDGLVGALTYSTALFDRATVERFAACLRRLFDAMIADAAMPVGRLPLLDPDQRSHLLDTFNATSAAYPRDETIHGLFEAQARRTPDAIAVADDTRQLAYAQLDAGAGALAHRLRALGVRRDDRIALCIDRSVDLAVGVLGILKAGAGYVPLDPSYPEERLRYMVGDCAPRAIVTTRALAASLPMLAAGSVPLLCVEDTDADDAMLLPSDEDARSPEQLAYVIYTSGSTGQPKGVQIEHRSAINLWAALEGDVFSRCAADARIALNAAFSFDASLQSLLQLLSGRCVRLVPADVRSDGAAMVDFLARERIEAFDCTPAQLELLVAGGLLASDRLPALRAILVGGDAISRTLWERLAASDIACFNVYGPTECTVDATIARIEAGVSPNIGRGIANTRIYLLDAHGQPVPEGICGELYIGGDGVARGYLGRDDLTAERFLTDPFSSKPGARMYRTGDLGRWRADGNIDYLGRNDFQVKIRGFRIELGEIEVALAQCPDVREAVVVARADGAGGKRLVAYLLTDVGHVHDATALRAVLSARLAEHMLPSAYVSMAAWPLTPNGKIDRRALPEPDDAAVALREYAAPEGETELALAAIWCELLKLERVGRNDHFFELGGHSLLAMQVVTHVRAKLGAELHLRDIFAQPTLSALAHGLSGRQRTQSTAIPHTDRAQPLPLSWAQQRLWFLDQLDHAAGAAYHMPAALRLHGTLDREALKKTLDRIVARHENLRTTFVDGADGPRQVIAHAESGFSLLEIDLEAMSADVREAELMRLVGREARAPFDLSTGPLIRGALVRLDHDDHALLLTQHHIVSDGWSMGVLVREVTALYAAFVDGRDDPLPPLPVQYADFAVWQRAWLQGDALREQLSFWRDHLHGAPSLLELPTDRPRPAVQGYAGDTVALHLPAALGAGLQALSQHHGITLFMTLTAAWATLLSRLTGQSDIVIGTPTANRQRAEIEPLIGFFVNTLALRVNVEDDPSVAALLARVKDITLDAYAHQDVPFEQVVEAVQPQRSLSYSPVFQTMLTFNNTPAGAEGQTVPGLRLSTIGHVRDTTHFDLELLLNESGESLAGGLAYSTALFERDTAERFAGHFVRVLEAMVADAAQPLSRIPLLSQAEREHVLETFNRTALDYPRALLVHQAFEAQVRRTPDAPALHCGSETLTYAQLNRRANRIGHRLIAAGVCPDDRVAICATRGPAMVAAVLGVLKSGGAYVPLDPLYPPDRLAYMFEDSAPVAMLTQSGLDASPDASTTPVLHLDDAMLCVDDAEPDAGDLLDPAPRGMAAQHLAYVIYTSGSTGQPKGVAIEHGNIANFIAWAHASFSPEELQNTLFATSINFDLAAYEMFAPLTCGSAIIVVADVLSTERARATSLINTVPSGIQALMSVDGVPRSVRTINLAGEPLKRALAERIFASTEITSLANLYGPTETTTYSTWVRMSREDGFVTHIGRPVANTRVYILDRHGMPVPVGVVGELFIGGEGVARGYLNRPDLTLERFLPDPFAVTPDARMYRTGDLGRWRADGNIEYLGRNDFQVKIRGFRIELGEIEARLGACEGVREATVLAREEAEGDKRLVAYVVPLDGAAPTAESLRAQLSAHLAEFMIPSAFVLLERFPLTPNGKLDRKALPAPDLDAVIRRAYEAPRPGLESALASIWCDLLRLEQVGRNDHFFELGGHSLLAVQLAAHVRAKLGLALALRGVFAHPTLASLAHLLDGQTREVQTSIPIADRTASLPLSWAQQRLWFLDQLDPAAGAAYHMPVALRLHGTLDRPALCRALDRLVARHEALRTTFAGGDGGPVQIIAPADVGFALEQRDLRMLDADAREAELRTQSVDEARAPFDLARGPLIRGRLLALADDEYALLLTQHHIVSDGWSLGLLVKELTTLYAAFVEGRDDPLPALSIQYADFAVWQRTWLQGEALRDQIEFWRSHLGGAPALLELPTDRPRPAVQRYAGDAVAVRLPADLGHALQAFSQRHGVTAFMTLVAAWSTLLSKLSGQTDIVIGTPVANRQRTEIEPLIGFFVNTIALRVSLDGRPTVAALMARIREATLDAYAHQDVPFEQVVEALQPQRSLSHSPIFQTMLSFNNTPGGSDLHVPGLRFGAIGGRRDTVHFDLDLSIGETPDGLTGSIAYATALFDRTTVERYSDYFVRLLGAMIADDRQAVHRLPLLPASERAQVLTGFGAARGAYDRADSLHGLFAERAAQQPDAVALRFDGASLTYGELDRRANRLAHRLVALGVRTDDRVAICAERGFEMLVGVLAILKAGGGYVPLDPVYPADRLQYMLADSAPVAVLAHGDLPERIAVLSEAGAPLVRIDDASLASEADTVPAVEVLASHLAYVIYTSGSTGQPKGVMVEHGHVTRLFTATDRWFGFGDGDVWTLFHSFAFDFSVWEIWGALLYGGRLVIVPELVARSPSEFYGLLSEEGVTVLNQTPSAFRALIPGQSDAPHRLRAVIFGGEALELHTLAPWVARNDAETTQLINMYGITEITVHATYRRITAADIEQARGSVIGCAIPDLRLYVLDADREPVPVGVIGELYVSGAGVTRGYLNREALTSERFVADPFSEVPGARMYKAGDLARWLPDGDLEYLGRNDFQVKIRGFRIELGEIEAKLGMCEGVREAVVIAREDASGDKRLVAYVVSDVEVSAGALRARLSQELAEYMIPSAFVQLSSLPLTANGKLDRRALPAPDAAAVALREYVAPQGEIEQSLADLWRTLLTLERVGRDDHFFEIGGHSLLAVQLVAQIRSTMGRELPLRAVFAEPTLAGLARLLAGTQDGAGHAPIPHADRRMPLPLSWAQQRLWFIDQLDRAAGAAYHIPVALRLHGRLDRDALAAALSRIVARHENLRTTFVEGEAGPVQVIAPSTVGLSLHEIDLRALTNEAREAALSRHAVEEARAPFDLAVGPLIRGRLLRLAEEDHALLLTQHHIVSDGWSMGVLMKEVTALYTAFVERREDPLPPLPVQYADYAVWQRGWLQGDVLERQLTYWREHMRGAPALLELPTDRPRPPVQNHAGAHVAIAVPDALAQGVSSLAKRHGVTLFMTLLGAWSTLLSRLSGQSDVVVGAPIANRQRTEVAPLIGFFVNTLALRVRLDDDPSVAALLARVRELTLEAYAHQDLPFEQIVEAVQPQRSLSHSPLFQTTLSLNHASPGDALEVSGLRFSALSSGRDTTHFDLDLSVEESGNGLSATLSYATALFDRQTVQGFADGLLRVLEAMTRDETLPVSRLPLLSDDARTAIVDGFNPVPVAFAGAQSLHGLFAHWVRQDPEAVALVFEGRSWSYATLDRAANRVAHRLIGLGVGREDRVALCAARGPDMVVGLLGVLKAGAAYVPLDPTYPDARLTYLFEDCGAVAVLTQSPLRARVEALAGGTRAPVLALDDASAFAAAPDDAPTIAESVASDLAYVIYTSGSTGLPKGVLVEHGGACNLAHALRERIGVSPGDRVLQFAAFSFDASVLELVLSLCHGASLHLAPREALLPVEPLARTLREQRITHVLLPPSVLAALAGESLGGPELTLISGGEALPASLARRWAAQHRLFNAYGPTEITVAATVHACSPEDAVVPIGRPLANTRVYILDAQGQPVPVGVVGELYVGGAGVARGYHAREALTSERFLPDPFSAASGARMYRTGDLGRWRPDGLIEYTGRNDEQVKIRGFRIELGEIESFLLQCEGVRDAAVVALDDGQGGKRLVAYVVPEGAPPSLASLGEALSRALAQHMLPAAYVVLDALPLMPNGKVDRKALPAPEAEAVLRRTHVAPEGECEIALAQLWCELLGLAQVGRDDHFFEIGGHSLMAVKLFAMLRQRFGAAPALGTIFTAPTLSALAAEIVRAGERATPTPLRVPLQTVRGDVRPLFCVHPVGGHIAVYRALAERLAPICPVHALQAPDVAGHPAATDLIALIDAHVDEIRAFQPCGPYRLAGWSTGGLFAAGIAARLRDAGEQVDYLGLIDTHALPEFGTPDDDALLALRAELAVRGLGLDQNATAALLAEGRSFATLATLSRAEALRYAGVEAVPGLDEGVFAQLLQQVPMTAAHLALLRADTHAAIDAPLHWVDASAARADRPLSSPRGERVDMVVAGHHALMREPHVARVSECIAQVLAVAPAVAGDRDAAMTEKVSA